VLSQLKQNEDTGFSDHNSLQITIESEIPKKISNKSSRRRIFSKQNIADFNTIAYLKEALDYPKTIIAIPTTATL
jgi:hypothetical protein